MKKKHRYRYPNRYIQKNISQSFFHLLQSQSPILPSAQFSSIISIRRTRMLHKETLLNSFRSYCALPWSFEVETPSKRKTPLCNGAVHFSASCTLQEATTGRENRLEVWCIHAYRVSILGVHTSSLFNWDLRGRVPYAASSRAPKASPGDHVDVALALEKDSRSMALNRENLMSSFFLRAKGGVLLPRNMAEVGYIQTFDEFWAGGRSQLGGDPWVVYGRLLYKLDEVRSCARCRFLIRILK